MVFFQKTIPAVYVGEFEDFRDKPLLFKGPRGEIIDDSDSQDLNPGDPWPNIFTGSRYKLKMDGRICFERRSTKQEIYAIENNCTKELRNKIRQFKWAGGFKINGYGKVLAKVEKYGIWLPIYICNFTEFNDLLLFKDVDGSIIDHSESLDPGEIWDPPRYYTPGFREPKTVGRYIVSGTGQIFAYKDGYRLPVIDDGNVRDLVQAILKIRPWGGRFLINEYRKILTLER